MKEAQQFVTGAGRPIYSFPVQSFANLMNNIYLIAGEEGWILVDCGSGLEQANGDLLAGFTAVPSTTICIVAYHNHTILRLL